jgi:eukaryotic-like serine/threonine-protein kinase
MLESFPPPAVAADPYDELIACARAHGGLPAVGHVFERLLRLLESDSEAVKELAGLVLADVSLTQRLLQFANTVPFRAGQGPVTTVSRAIVLLGFNRVRATVASLVMLDGLVGPGHSTQVRAEFRAALVAGGLAREILAEVDPDEAEVAGIGAMFRSVGRLLLAIFNPHLWARIGTCVRDEGVSETAAARRLLGRPVEELSAAVLRGWHVPDPILSALQAVPARLEAPRAGATRIRVAAQFADEIGTVLRHSDDAVDRATLEAVLDRFAPALALDLGRLGALLDAALERVDAFEASCGLTTTPPPPMLRRATLALQWTDFAAAQATGAATAARAPSGAASSTSLLASALAEASVALAGAPDAATALRQIVPGLLRAIQMGLGFRRAALVLRDASGGAFRVRMLSGGPTLTLDAPEAAAEIAAAVADGRDRYLHDLTRAADRSTLPAALVRHLPPAGSALLLPLAVSGRVLGFVLADRDAPASAVAAEHLDLLRALRGQVLLALRLRPGAAA